MPKQQATRARQEIGLADGYLHSDSDPGNPDDWAALAHQATALRNQALRNHEFRMATDRQILIGQQRGPELDDSFVRAGPELGL